MNNMHMNNLKLNEVQKGRMKPLKIKKRFITLVEMMIVMFLIAMITGVIAYNYTGSLEEGKAFKTKHGIEKIHTVLDLYLATHPEDRDNIDTQWKSIVNASKMVKNPDELTRDGWGNEYEVSRGSDDAIVIKSERYNTYKAQNKAGSMFSK